MKKTSVITLLGVTLLLCCLIYPVSAVGVFRNSDGYWYLDYNNTGIIDKTFRFGTTGDIPMTGDWQGTGSDGIAIFRPSTGYWYFDNNLDGTIDKSFRYGSSTDQIIKGDWQGTGRDGIAIFRPSTGYWYFDNNLDGTIDKSFRYGNTGDRIIVGKWQGTGRDGIAIFRPSTGYWYFDYNLDGISDKSFRYGSSTDQIIKGDWQGTGRDGIAIFRPSTGYWYFDNLINGSIDMSFRYGSSNDRIVVGKWVESVAPHADFTVDKRSGTAPLTVNFTCQSTGTAPLSYAWDFTNDGINESTAQSPSFTYPAAGTYSVRLTVTNAAGSDAEIKTGYITVSPAPVAPVAAFTADIRSGYAPLTVHFTNQSTGTAPLMYSWDFNGDYEEDSDVGNPTFTYTTPGTYTVTLTVTNSVGTDYDSKIGFITVNAVQTTPIAAFSASRRSGNAPLAVTFNDQSTGASPLTYLWDFTNDGQNTSSLKNPQFTYTSPGTYTVKLTVTNHLGSDIATKTNYILVTEGQSGPHAGVALTFDDCSIDQWYGIRDMLQRYNAHATFFVSGFSNLDSNQISELLTLQEEGQEIGFHGTHHIDAAPYLLNHSIQEYIDYEITPDLTVMRNSGLNPVGFSYPGGSEDPALSEALHDIFTHVRGIDHGSMYYEYGSNPPVIYAQGIDDTTYGQSMDNIYSYLAEAKSQDTIVVFYAHVPVETVTGNYMVSHERLENILKYVSDNNMQFYTISELN